MFETHNPSLRASAARELIEDWQEVKVWADYAMTARVDEHKGKPALLVAYPMSCCEWAEMNNVRIALICYFLLKGANSVQEAFAQATGEEAWGAI